jgi:hypothetical protein
MATHTKKHIKNTGSKASSELYFADKTAGEEYAEIIAAKGSCRFEARIIRTGEAVNVPLRGKLTQGRTKQLVKKDDIVLLVPNISDGYIVDYRYGPEEVKSLRKAGELTQVVETAASNGLTVAYSNEATNAMQQSTVIDDDMIANL